MEPGLRDREYGLVRDEEPEESYHAAMEPGLRDREYCACVRVCVCVCVAAMEPGLRDREYSGSDGGGCARPIGCNGARS